MFNIKLKEMIILP